MTFNQNYLTLGRGQNCPLQFLEGQLKAHAKIGKYISNNSSLKSKKVTKFTMRA